MRFSRGVHRIQIDCSTLFYVPNFGKVNHEPIQKIVRTLDDRESQNPEQNH